MENHRDELLAFAKQLDQDLRTLAEDYAAPATLVAEVRRVLSLPANGPERWRQEQVLWQRLGSGCAGLRAAVTALLGQVVRASSVIENLNSRLRNYFFLRRRLGADYLALWQFFLNHRRFLRSEHAEARRQKPGRTAHGRNASALADAARLHAVFQELGRNTGRPPVKPDGAAQGPYCYLK